MPLTDSSDDEDDETYAPKKLQVASQSTTTRKRITPMISDDEDSSDDDDAPIARMTRKPPMKMPAMEEDSSSSSSSSDEDAPIGLTLRKKRAPPNRYRPPPARTRTPQKRRRAPPTPVRKRKAKQGFAARQAKRRKSSATEPKIFNAKNYDTRDHIPLQSEQGAIKWWDAKPYSGDQKWRRLEHNGVVFAPPYEAHGVKMKYDGKPMDLTPEQEECATWFATILESDHAQNPTFCKNFFKDWCALLRHPNAEIKHPEIVEFEKCNFRPIFEWTQKRKEKMKLKRKVKAYKIATKEEKQKADSIYGYALVDGVKEKVGNYKVEPPGLFRGRGAHPKTGMIKKRLWPEDIILNISKGTPIPKCPLSGRNWGGVCHDNTVTYIAKWVENINGARKFVYLHSSSRFKGAADRAKYDKARKLKNHIGKIRKTYTSMLQYGKTVKIRQLATAVWMIDILAIRVGNEKDVSEEADTVGVCSLRFEHIKLLSSLKAEFDFLGKDSMRYFNQVSFPDIVYTNVQNFLKNKKKGDDLFETITPSDVNEFLKGHMEGLSAKVFRTYNASITLQKELDRAFTEDDLPMIGQLKTTSAVDEKTYFYNEANKRVAILCNHQKSVSKNHTEQMQKLEQKLEEKQQKMKDLKKELKWAKGKGKPPASWRRKDEEKVEVTMKKTESQIRKLKLNQKLKADHKEVSLSTSKINYMDPRITIAFCKRMQLPLEKVFNKSLLEKFPWACASEPTYRF